MDTFDENPFEDPSIRQTRANAQPVESIIDFNPFADSSTNKPVISSQPAVVQANADEPPPYTMASKLINPPLTDELRRQQEDLDRRAAELERREEEMRRTIASSGAARLNNFPPLPSWFPIKPCFFQDFSLDIPMEFQKLVKQHYYIWIAYGCVLLVNFFGSIAYLAINGSQGASTFGLSIFFFLLFTPCAFVCWFRPLYKAFRSDSSFNFFYYFFVFFMQFCVNIIQCLGIAGSGTVGFISGFTSIALHPGVGVFFLFIGLLFCALAASSLYLLFKVHRIYRASGASFAKAQEEFAKGVFSNPTVRSTASNMASSAAQEAVNQSLNARH